jgi:hypothetical protein
LGTMLQHFHNVPVPADREAGSHPTGSTPATYQRQDCKSTLQGLAALLGRMSHAAQNGSSALQSTSEGSFSCNPKIWLPEIETVPRPVTRAYEGSGVVAVPGTPEHLYSLPQVPTIRFGHPH